MTSRDSCRTSCSPEIRWLSNACILIDTNVTNRLSYQSYLIIPNHTLSYVTTHHSRAEPAMPRSGLLCHALGTPSTFMPVRDFYALETKHQRRECHIIKGRPSSRIHSLKPHSSILLIHSGAGTISQELLKAFSSSRNTRRLEDLEEATRQIVLKKRYHLNRTVRDT